PLVFSMICALPLAPASARGFDGAILAEGTEIRLGVAGFGPNAISCLYGRYETPGKDRVAEVWATSEPLVFNSSVWVMDPTIKRKDVLYNGSERGRRIWAFRKKILTRERSDVAKDWTFVIGFAEGTDEAECRAFAEDFVRRAERIFASTRLRSDLSFPATF
ncbi:MAG TPA: hypothetical protein PKO22_11335, partial [Treponemataceae bacterium]|nr:hypothetical protein [Treponemataceae bacterium]